MTNQTPCARAVTRIGTIPLVIMLLAQQPTLPADKRVPDPLVGPGNSPERSLVVTSTFKNGDVVPLQYTRDGSDISPPLNWSRAPADTKSIAVICSDPDAPGGTWYHWLLYNLPGDTVSLVTNIPKQPSIFSGAKQGLNDFNRVGYNGPAPPPGAKHRYFFRVMALDTNLPLKPEARKGEVLNAIRGHILAEGEIMGVYWH